MDRVGKDAVNQSFFDNHPAIHHRHTITERLDHRHFMGDHHHGQTKAFVDVFKQIKDLTGGFRIQGRGDLVTQQNLRA